MKINIASPAYGHSYSSEYVTSLYQLTRVLERQKINSSFSEISYADIVDARNFLISNFYFRKTDCTHCLMIDTDMGYPPQLILDMLALDKHVVGVAAPRKSEGFVIGRLFGQARDGFRQTDRCGTGIFLVSRAAINEMISKLPDIVDTKRAKLGNLTEVIRPFDRITTDDAVLSEDVSFCERWRQCGGEIWVNLAHEIKHVGRRVYSGSYEGKST